MFKVMIVDNETAIRKGLAHCIDWKSMDCVVAAQAEDGIDALNQIPAVCPDIVICDIRMPEMDGLELVRHLHETYPHIQAIIITGFPDFEYAQRAIEYRVVDFVLKPTSVEALTQSIEKAKARIAEESSNQHLAQKLADQSEQNLLLQRAMLLHDLIGRVNLSRLYTLDRMSRLELDLTNYYVVRLDIEPIEEEETELLAYLQQAQHVFADCLSEYPVYFVPYGDQVCFAVVCCPETDRLTGLCREAVDIIGSLPRFRLYIGVSRHYSDPVSMADAADEAGQAVQFARHSPEQPVVSFFQMPVIPHQIMDHIFAYLRLLKSSIENQNSGGTLKIIAELFDFIRENKIPIEEIRNICVYIHQFCINPLFFNGAENYAVEIGLPALKKLIDGGSVDSLEKNMLTFAESMLERMACDASGQGNLIHTIKSHIAQHYREELSLEGLAGLVYLSPSYLSKLFKRETGENLSTYMQNVRIDAAKILLRTTPLKTYEVAERVGISDPVYFSRIFKKVVGVKPKDYRKNETDHPIS